MDDLQLKIQDLFAKTPSYGVVNSPDRQGLGTPSFGSECNNQVDGISVLAKVVAK